MDGDDLLKSGAGASATGLFGTAAKEPANENEPAAQRPAPVSAPEKKQEPANTASSGGFTQLLRALNYDAVKGAQAAGNDAVPAAGGSMEPTPVPAAEPASEAVTAAKPVVAVAPGQVTSFLPQSAPVALPVAAPSSGQRAGSFTQLFQKLDAEPTKEIVPEEIMESPSPGPSSFTQLFAVPEATLAAAPVTQQGEPPASSGSFTQLFAAVDAGPERPAVPLMMDSVRENVLAKVAGAAPERVEAPVPAAPLEASAPSSPGSFTQMFQALDAPSAEPVRREAAPLGGNTGAATPGSFTQMFQALGTPAADEQARYVPPPVVEAPKQAAPPATSPGSFTQMFRTLGEEPLRAKEPDAGPGSFTRMFESVAPSAPVVPPPPSSYERPFAASAAEPEGSGASQMFATYREPTPVAADRGPAFSPMQPAPLGPSPVSSAPSSGGLTQLLRTLDQPTQAPKPYAAPSYPPPSSPASQPGSFTGVYGELGGTSAVAPQASAPEPQPASGAGPSEFTRLINASALREAGLRGGGDAAAGAGAPAASPAAGGAGFAMPGGMPAVPHASFAAPHGSFAAPQASIAGPGGAHGAVSAAGGGHASFAAPKLPSAPPVKMPELPKGAAAPAGMQKYVPLLLILVIFLLLAILVAVVVLMKK